MPERCPANLDELLSAKKMKELKKKSIVEIKALECTYGHLLLDNQL